MCFFARAVPWDHAGTEESERDRKGDRDRDIRGRNERATGGAALFLSLCDPATREEEGSSAGTLPKYGDLHVLGRHFTQGNIRLDKSSQSYKKN